MSLIFTNGNQNQLSKKHPSKRKISRSKNCIFSRSDYVRNPRDSFVSQDDELVFSDDFVASASASSANSKKQKSASASEQVHVKLEFPGNEYQRPKRSDLATGEIFTFQYIANDIVGIELPACATLYASCDRVFSEELRARHVALEKSPRAASLCPLHRVLPKSTNNFHPEIQV